LKSGITFFVASGDAGAGNINRGGTCGTYAPQALSSCPYVTTVGGTFATHLGTEVLSVASRSQGNNIVSGGGFSKIFTEENNFKFSYQTKAVEEWMAKPGASKSVNTYKLQNGGVGAAYPDVSALSANIFTMDGTIAQSTGGNFFTSAQSIGGTSAATPMFAGMISLCATQLPANVAGFGQINHILYKNKDVFFDIKGDNNSYGSCGPRSDPISCYEGCKMLKLGSLGCESGSPGYGCHIQNATRPFYGFEATEGWDPASGLGTLGTTDPNDKTKGFLGLCNALLKANGVTNGWDSKKSNCDKKAKKKDKKSKAKKKDKKSKATKGRQ